MAKRMDPILPVLSILGYWAIILGSFGGPGIGRIEIIFPPRHNKFNLFHEDEDVEAQHVKSSPSGLE